MGRVPLGYAALAGIGATVLGAGVGEVAAALLAPGSSPFAAIGSALIDLAPPWAKDAAIALFGTADKIALLVGIGIVLLAVAAGAGVLESRRPPWGAVLLGLAGVAGIVAAATRADAGTLSWVPSALAGAVSVFAVRFLVRRLEPVSAADAEGPDRRTFLVWALGSAAVGIAVAVVGSTIRSAGRAVEAVRSALTLPAPTAPGPAVPAAADLGIPGLTPYLTPNAEFYRIDTALIVPEVDPADWELRIHGMVAREVRITWDDLLALPLEESVTTLTCVSNTVGGDLIGNARWLGYPIRELLARAEPDADADMVLSSSIDGFTASTPLEVLTDDREAILAIGMNGEPLPLEHGFPVRMVVPGLYGYVSATKWVVDLEVTRFDRATAYWTTRGWTERGPVKLESRIDVPRSDIAAGDTVIAGVAWQQHVGVSGVEVQIDEGDWEPADLAAAVSDDTWVQWSFPWSATAGRHRIRCRAISADGTTQTADVAPPAPDGATGYHEVTVAVG